MTGAYGVTQYDADGCLNASYDFLEYLKGVLDAIGDRIGTEELARAAGDAALSLRIDGLTTTSFDEILLELANLSGRITQETDIRIEGDEIIATRIDAVEVTAGNTAASVIQEATARASEIAAMASLVTAVTARVGSAEAAITTEQTARATADTALATSITTVNARVDTTEASITSEQTARANAIAALASTLTVLTTRVGTAESTITTESIARTAENYSLATRIDTLEATVTGGPEGVIEALVQAEAEARADADGALANTINTLTARMFSAEGAITTEQAVRSTADSAFATQITDVTASITGSGNLLMNTDFADMTTSGWLNANTGNGATYGGIGLNAPNDNWRPPNENVLSMVQTNRVGVPHYGVWGQNGIVVRALSYYQFYAFITAQDAPVQVIVNFYDISDNLINTKESLTVFPGYGGKDPNTWTQIGLPSVQAPANAVRAYFEVRKFDTNAGSSGSWMWVWRPYFGSARAGQTAFNPFSHGSAKLNIQNAFAQITLANEARVTATEAIALQIETINTTLGNHTASITNTSSSVDGLLLKHSILLNSNGHITGFIQNNNGSSGSFTVVADNFSIIAPNGGSPVTPFSVTAEGVRVNGNLVVSGSIGTGQLGLNAATAPYSMNTSVNTSLPGVNGGGVDLITLTLTPTNSNTVFLSASVDVANLSTTLLYNVQFQIVVNGAVVFTSENVVLDVNGVAGNSSFWNYAGQFAVNLSVANNLTIRAVTQNSYGNYAARSVNKSIFALELKR